MENQIIFKTFQTYKNNYIFDRHTNSVFAVDSKEYDELRRVEHKLLDHRDSSVVKKYQSLGMLQPNVVQRINHPQTNEIEHHSRKRLESLILQVTQQCNLRCGYCAYSGLYQSNRVHSSSRMSFETAKKAIDFFLDHNTEIPETNIGFYGGEPFLEFDLIKRCVDYLKKRIEGKKEFSINTTTNATLLKGEIADYVVENEFDIGISLDGPKEAHDKNRRFENGRGSFDIVMQNIKDLLDKYPDYNKHLRIMTTVNPYVDLGCVLEFFTTNEILNDTGIMFNNMTESNLKNKISYDESYNRVRRYEYIKMLLHMIGKLDKEYVSDLMLSSKSATDRFRKIIHQKTGLAPITTHGGPCLPGVMRLFTSTDGKFYPCERVGEIEYFNIGSVDDGFYIDKMKRLLNIGNITEDKCIDCWNLPNCMICSKEIDLGDKQEPTRENKLPVCKTKQIGVKNDLYEQCVLKEFGYELKLEDM